MRNTKNFKSKPWFIFKRFFKGFDEQAVLHDMFLSDLSRVTFIPNIELAWEYFNSSMFQLKVLGSVEKIILGFQIVFQNKFIYEIRHWLKIDS